MLFCQDLSEFHNPLWKETDCGEVNAQDLSKLAVKGMFVL